MDNSQVEEIECSICLEPFTSTNDTAVIPVLLICGHTFHRMCLANIPSIQGNDTEIECPLCRAGTPGPVQSLKPNYMLLELLALLKEEEKKAIQKVLCDECSTKEGLIFCLQCNANLCCDCDKIIHLPKILQIHKRVPISQKPDPSTSICSEHKKELEIFCIECKSLICLYCRDYGPHQGHKTDLKQNMVAGIVEAKGTSQGVEGGHSSCKPKVSEEARLAEDVRLAAEEARLGKRSAIGTDSRQCNACLRHLPKRAFTFVQWQKSNNRRCKDCQDANNPIQSNKQ